MKLTTRGYYSIKALLDLSLQANYGPASVREIAKRQSIPAPYLEKLLIKLRRAGLVESIRGAHGGYKLERSPDLISLGHILEAVGESIEPMPKIRTQSNAEDWVTYMVWQRLNQRVKVAIYEISLEDLYYDARSWQAAQGEAISFIV
ncbi:MAG: Rrf2 family transcriptional regulator [Cyanothece sp. SIO2G6]|nr:Rrf2 family transcriptional regulator [Cyanothece sp. SIO2G6]